MTVLPKTPTDLTIAPVAVAIDLNLQRIRDATTERIVDEVALTLNRGPGANREERARQVVEFATRGVDLHGWSAVISADASRLQLRGGSVGLDLGLSARIRSFIELGPL